jgi:hypothetical protein
MITSKNDDSLLAFLGLRQIGKVYDFTVGKLFFDAIAVWKNHRKCAKSYDG